MTAGTDEYTAQAAKIEEAKAAVKSLQDEEAAESALYAGLEKEDAEEALSRLSDELESRANAIKERKNENGFLERQISSLVN